MRLLPILWLALSALAGTSPLELEVHVFGEDDKRVRDLTADDFAVVIDGESRAVENLTYLGQRSGADADPDGDYAYEPTKFVVLFPKGPSLGTSSTISCFRPTNCR